MTRAALCLTALAMALPALAEAQCPNGALVCAEVNVSGSLHIGRRPRRAQTVVVQAQPPRPQGRVVVVQPAPPPPPPPPHETVVVIETTEPDIQVRRVRRVPDMRQKLGVHARVGFMASPDVTLGGAHLGFRFRPSRIFALELGVGAYGGEDYNGQERVEVPLTFDAYFFLPRASFFQLYLVGGMHTSFAHTEGFHEGYQEVMTREMRHFGGQLGVGGEWRVLPRLGLSADVRAFLRRRVDDNDNRPEFIDVAGGRESDTSAGALVNLGATLYF